MNRRSFLDYTTSLGLSGTLLPGVLWSRLASGADITAETIKCAEEIAGLEFTGEQRAQMVEGLRNQQRQIQSLHAVRLENSVEPALLFDPLPPGEPMPPAPPPRRVAPVRSPVTPRRVTGNIDELAFLTVNELAELVRTRRVTSEALTVMYLERIARHDPALHAVVTITRERALRQARAADTEIRRGSYRGPLHGIPWGAKDLLAVSGYPTTWGATPFRQQVFDEDATVVKRLDDAGAVLIAKLTLGELAMGDTWYGGRTRNPWNVEQGSSGSSAGPGAATAAGLVAFAIGSETLGSISSPSTVNGVSGLRPTFGRVPRTGAMALSWSMDKLGPMCRSAEDCALVLDAIHGPDGADRSVRAAAFRWDASRGVRALRVGFVQSAFDERDRQRHATVDFDDAALAALRSLGVTLRPVELPDVPYNAMRIILNAEAAAAFDDLTRSGRDRELAQQGPGAWPASFRRARFIPAVEYVNANRLRSLAMQGWAELMRELDVIVAPTSGPQLLATNLTGHPAVIVPNGFREDGTPVSLTFIGRLYGEDTLLALAHAYQSVTDWHRRYPPAFAPRPG